MLINRTGVAGAVLQSPPSLIHWFNDSLSQRSFSSKSSEHHKSQTIRARDLKCWHNVYHLSCVTLWHLPPVASDVSPITCHLSWVPCPQGKKKVVRRKEKDWNEEKTWRKTRANTILPYCWQSDKMMSTNVFFVLESAPFRQCKMQLYPLHLSPLGANLNDQNWSQPNDRCAQ